MNSSNSGSDRPSNFDDQASSKSKSSVTKSDCMTTGEETSSSTVPLTSSATTSKSHDRQSSTTSSAEQNTHEFSPQQKNTFPYKMQRILSDESISDTVSWLPHGKSWIIHQQNDFEQQVLPKYFGSTKMASFARQVTGWGFRRITAKGPDHKSYYHPMFKRDDDEYKKMKRPVKVKEHEEDAPNFYNFPMVGNGARADVGTRLSQIPRDDNTTSQYSALSMQPQVQTMSNLLLAPHQELQHEYKLGPRGYILPNDVSNALTNSQFWINPSVPSIQTHQQYGLNGLSLAQQQLLLGTQNLRTQNHNPTINTAATSSGFHGSLAPPPSLGQDPNHLLTTQQLIARQLGSQQQNRDGNNPPSPFGEDKVDEDKWK